MFSILILTKDEELNIPSCLDSVSWCDDVVVLDSYSTDATISLAATRGARIFQREFDNFGDQRNFALDTIHFRHRWIFHLDADERFNPELLAACVHAISKDEHSAYFVPNRIIFLGRWIRHCTQYPYPQVRLIKLGEVRFAKAGHGQREDEAVRGVGHIHVPYDHFNFSKGIADWVNKHNRYSDEEALLSATLSTEPIHLRNIFSPDLTTRARARKWLQSRLPARPLAKFLYLYVFKMGFLDGYPGFMYCALQFFYDFLICAKIAERNFTSAGQDCGSQQNVT